MKAPFQFRLFMVERRKLYELTALPVFSLVLYFVLGRLDSAMLFGLGFVWNWTASQPVNYVFENRRYRFSLMKMVYNLQFLFTWPVRKLHPIFSIIPKALPAGLFWCLIIHFMDSELPVWPTFAGSFVFELLQVDVIFKRPAQELPPPPPPAE